MKKISLLLFLFSILQTSFGQAIIGTASNTDIDFYTNGGRHGRWTKEGPLLIDTITLPNSPSTVGIVVNNDVLMNDCYIKSGNKISSSVYGYQTSPTYTSGDYASIVLDDGTSNHYMFLQALITGKESGGTIAYKPMFLNSEGGKVIIGTTTVASYDLFQVNGTTNSLGYVVPIRTITSSDNVLNGDYTVLVDASSNDVSVTLGGSAYFNTGRVVCIKRMDGSPYSHNVHIYPSSGYSIDGLRPYDLTTQYQSVMLQFTGTNWVVLSKN